MELQKTDGIRRPLRAERLQVGSRRKQLLTTGLILVLFIPQLRAEPADKRSQTPREPIGEVLGKSVYRDEIRAGLPLKDELNVLFLDPLMDHYHKTHRKEMEPTNKEIRATNEFFGEKHRRLMVTYEPQIRKRLDDVEDRLAREVLSAEEKQNLKSEKSSLEAELAPWNDREFSKVWLTNWKFQRHLYERYGGGRILCHKFGMEAFDAMRSWLKAQESKGNLKITDPEVRAEFYAHWTIATKQRTFLSQDRETIRREFLQPEWVPTRRGD